MEEFYAHITDYAVRDYLRSLPYFERVWEYAAKEVTYEFGRLNLGSFSLRIISGLPPVYSCPWCGSEHRKLIQVDIDTYIDLDFVLFQMECQNCGARGPKEKVRKFALNYKNIADSVEEFIDTCWSTRKYPLTEKPEEGSVT